KADQPWARSPDGSLLAVASGRARTVLIVDLARMRVVREVALPALAAALAWPAADRVVAVAYGRCCSSPLRALVMGPGQGRVVAPDPRVAVVDLRTCAVSVHGLPERSLADGGISAGFYRRAVWAGGGVIALTGRDDAVIGAGAQARQQSSAFGLRLIDTRSWT